MIVDVRELILLRLMAICGEIDHPAALNVARNRAGFPADRRPGFVVLDGEERAVLDGQERGRARNSPVKLRLSAQIWVQLKVLPVANSDQTGVELSALRMKVIDAIRTDADLIALTGENGDIAYKGHVTDMQSGSTMEGQMMFLFDIDYWLKPEDLIA